MFLNKLKLWKKLLIMKIIKFTAFLLLLFCFKFKAIAQQSHPTINNVDVWYKSEPPSASTGTTNSSGFQAAPQATITLKPSVNVSKIYFKIIDNVTNSIIYQINYAINSATITNSSGKKLFENNNGTIFISNGVELPLKPYKYEITTEDVPGNLSPVFSVVK